MSKRREKKHLTVGPQSLDMIRFLDRLADTLPMTPPETTGSCSESLSCMCSSTNPKRVSEHKKVSVNTLDKYLVKL